MYFLWNGEMGLSLKKKKFFFLMAKPNISCNNLGFFISLIRIKKLYSLVFNARILVPIEV